MPNVFRFRRLSEAPEPNRNSEAVYANAAGELKQVAPDGSETDLGGGGGSGGVRVLKHAFDFSQAADLAVGVSVFDFAAGDLLLDAFVVTSADDYWTTSSKLAHAEVGVIDAGSWVDSGFFNRSTGPPELGSSTWDAAAPFLRYSHDFGEAPPTLLGEAIASGDGAYCDPLTVFSGAATLSLVVSHDGLPGGDATDADSGSSTLYLVVSTPADAS